MAAGGGGVNGHLAADTFTSPFGGEVGAQRRVKGPLLSPVHGEGPLTRPKRVDLSARGRGKE